MSEPETQRAAGETPDDGPLLEELRELIGEKGQLRVAELLEVSERTLQRTLASGRLTVRMRDILELRRLSAAHERALAHIQMLTAELREARDKTAEQPAPSAPPRAESPEGARSPAPPLLQTAPQPVIGHPKAVRPWRPWPDVVTPEPEDGEELVYGEAAPLIVAWRQAQADGRDEHRSRVERATAWVRAYELELALIGDRGLTLPPAAHPWDRFDRRRQLHRREQYLRAARRERQRALCWRFLRRVLTFGMRRR